MGRKGLNRKNKETNKNYIYCESNAREKKNLI